MDGEEVVRRYDAPHEAELAAAHLRSIGIDARIDNATLTGMNPLWGYAVGGIQVLVPLKDAKRARRSLDKLEAPSTEDDPDDDLHTPSDEEDKVAARAFRAAILGIFFCPVGIHLYSLVLLSGVGPNLSPAGRRKRKAALVVDVAVLVLALGAVVLASSRP